MKPSEADILNQGPGYRVKMTPINIVWFWLDLF